jgi:hypothetical protein
MQSPGTDNSDCFDRLWMLTTIGDYFGCRSAASDCDALAIKGQGTGEQNASDPRDPAPSVS